MEVFVFIIIISFIKNKLVLYLFNDRLKLFDMKSVGLNTGLLILRLSVGVLMLLHGISKVINGLGWIKESLASMGVPEFVAYGVLVGEILAPLFIIIGFRTRAFAAIFMFNMVVAIAMAHTADIFSLSNTGGWSIELPALYLLAALSLVFTGAGKYAVSSSKRFD